MTEQASQLLDEIRDTRVTVYCAVYSDCKTKTTTLGICTAIRMSRFSKVEHKEIKRKCIVGFHVDGVLTFHDLNPIDFFFSPIIHYLT